MKSILETYWQALQRKFPEEQVFYLSIIIVFSEFQRRRHNLDIPETFTQIYFCERAFDIPKYDIHEAALQLCEKVDWALAENDDEVQKIIQSTFRTIRDIPHFNILLESIMELIGTSGGYIATPQSVRSLIADLLGETSPESISDFCSGIGMFGLELARKISMDKTSELFPSSFCGIEMNPVLCAIGKLIIELYEIEGQLVQKDILTPPPASEMSLYDLIVMDMPRGNNKRESFDRNDPRLTDFKEKTVYTDWIFIQDVLYHLKEGGYAAVLCTTGALIRANERSLRKSVVQNDWLEAVITLPANLYPNTRTGTELLIFHKGNRGRRRHKILFVDINKYYFRERRNAYAISEEGHRLVCASFGKYEKQDGISAVISPDMLEEQTCSWKPVQYISQEQVAATGGSVRLADVAEIVRGAQAVNKAVGTPGKMVCFLNIKDIQDGFVKYETADKISVSNPACKTKYRIQEDDILITSKGTTIKIAIVEANPMLAYISGNITLLRVNKQMYDPYVLFHYLDSEQGRASLEQIQSGTTIRILNNSNLSALKVPLYDAELMSKIGAQLKIKREGYLKNLNFLIDSYNTERKNLLDSLKEEM